MTAKERKVVLEAKEDFRDSMNVIFDSINEKHWDVQGTACVFASSIGNGFMDAVFNTMDRQGETELVDDETGEFSEDVIGRTSAFIKELICALMLYV